MILTVGHSNRSLADFLALLRAHRVGLLADVRAFPASRAHPHFARESLEAALAGAGIGYCWIPELGGRRRRPPGPPRFGGWTEPAFQAYEAHMATAEFEAGLARLLEAAGLRSAGPGSPGPGGAAAAGAGPDAAAPASSLPPVPGQPGAPERRVAVMCAEAVWWRCHRSMIADALAARGVAVGHLVGDREVPHPLEARRSRYPPGLLTGGGAGPAPSGEPPRDAELPDGT